MRLNSSHMARPRTTQDYSGSILGAVIGGLLGGPLGSAVVGAGLGAIGGTIANTQKSLPLDIALAAYLAQKGLACGGVQRRAWNQVRIVAGQNSHFFSIDVGVAPKRNLYADGDALDDALYDAATKKIDEHARTLGLG